jgi:hypothetical protein
MLNIRNKPHSYLLDMILLFFLSFSFYFQLRNDINSIFEQGFVYIFIRSGSIFLGLLIVPLLQKYGKLPLQIMIYLSISVIIIDILYLCEMIPTNTIWNLVCLSFMAFMTGTYIIHFSWRHKSLESPSVMLFLGSAILVSSLWFPLNGELILIILLSLACISILISFYLAPITEIERTTVKHPFLDWACFAIRFMIVFVFNYLIIYGMFSGHFFEIMYKIFGYWGVRYFAEAEMIQFSMLSIGGGLALSFIINMFFQHKLIQDGTFSLRNWILLFGILLIDGIIIWVIVEISTPFSAFQLLIYLFFGLLGFSEGMIYGGFFILEYSSFVQGTTASCIFSKHVQG